MKSIDEENPNMYSKYTCVQKILEGLTKNHSVNLQPEQRGRIFVFLPSAAVHKLNASVIKFSVLLLLNLLGQSNNVYKHFFPNSYTLKKKYKQRVFLLFYELIFNFFPFVRDVRISQMSVPVGHQQYIFELLQPTCCNIETNINN